MSSCALLLRAPVKSRCVAVPPSVLRGNSNFSSASPFLCHALRVNVERRLLKPQASRLSYRSPAPNQFSVPFLSFSFLHHNNTARRSEGCPCSSVALRFSSASASTARLAPSPSLSLGGALEKGRETAKAVGFSAFRSPSPLSLSPSPSLPPSPSTQRERDPLSSLRWTRGPATPARPSARSSTSSRATQR